MDSIFNIFEDRNSLMNSDTSLISHTTILEKNNFLTFIEGLPK